MIRVSEHDALSIVSSPLHPVHPRGSQAKILLTSVFGPYAQDDQYGSRAMNPMELYHNQVTRVQGPYSLRMFHRSWGLMMIQANVAAPCTMLDFPVLDRFIEELRNNSYDIIGISSIPINVAKVRKMCELVREYQPGAKIVIGGHIANVADLLEKVDADLVARGEGIRWFRRYLGEDEDQPVRHPLVTSGYGTRNVGMTLPDKRGDVAAAVVPSVGCPMGCNFCSTSAMFGGKGNFVDFYETGDELFDVMCGIEEAMKVQSFFMMDENFLLHRSRALRLLELMQEHDKAWSLYVFSSANVLRSYSIEQLIGLGVSWIWMGIEGKDSQYSKLKNIDSRELVRELQSHGIHVLGSTIIGLENHTPENIDEAIDYAASHDADFHQFMLYTPVDGTPLHAELTAKGVMKDPSEIDPADVHGQYQFNYRHPHIKDGAEAEMMIRAFTRDFEVNGPSVVRIVRTTLDGWKRYKNHPDPRVRRHYAWEAKDMATTHAALVAASKLYYRKDPAMYAKMSALLKRVYREAGIKSRIFGAIGGRYLLWKIRREEKRLAAGWTYEPPTFYDKNEAAMKADGGASSGAAPCRSVACRAPAVHSAPARLKSRQRMTVS